MTRTTFTLAGLALAVTLLVSAQVKADMVNSVNFSFISTAGVFEQANDVADLLDLTATERADGSGVDFRFISGWTGGNPAVNGGRGNIWNASNGGLHKESVYFYNHPVSPPSGSDIFSTSIHNPPSSVEVTATRGGSFSVRAGNFVQLGEEYGVEFFIPYAGGGGKWEAFLNALDPEKNPYEESLYFAVHIGNLGGGEDNVEYATFRTSGYSDASYEEAPAPAPEPATLAVLGLGLAGVGLASRRRRK